MCLVSLDFNHSNTKQESLAEQAVWHRQKRFSKNFPEHNPHTQLCWTQVPHKCGFFPTGFFNSTRFTARNHCYNKREKIIYQTQKLPCFFCWIYSVHITVQWSHTKATQPKIQELLPRKWVIFVNNGRPARGIIVSRPSQLFMPLDLVRKSTNAM